MKWLSLSLVALLIGSSGCSGDATAPYESGSPWPKFRGNAAQDGKSARTPPSTGGLFWSFQTGKGIFSSPVVGADGTVYVGSADRTFYALDPDGTVRWQTLTGEIIDSAALLDDSGRVYVGSGDGWLRAFDARTGELTWKTAADAPGVNGSYINWFEGNVALSPSGELYAPNDDFFVYTLDRKSGAITGRARMPDQIWSSPAFDAGSHWYVGNNNVVQFLGSNLFAFDGGGGARWDNFIGMGSVAASPMVTPSGLVVVGGFDGYVRAFDAATGAQRWQFAARDHLYASPARLGDGTIVQAGTDGTVYALDGDSGAVRWTFDIRDPIRSSPSVDGADRIYFGAGDGRLYVLEPDGRLRWSMQLVDAPRNDINSSPALGRDAVYVGAESGELFSVPYDYCLRPEQQGDPRCTAPSLPLADDGGMLLYTTEFGEQRVAPPGGTLDPNQPIVLSLVARAGGHELLALLDPASIRVTFDPPGQTFTVDVAGNGRFVTITPTQPLVGDANQRITLDVSADFLVDPERQGLKLSGGRPGGTATAHLPATIAQYAGQPAAPTPGRVWEVRRIALPLPTLLPSYNQIGFDSLHYLITVVGTNNGHTIAWLAGAKLAADSNRTVIDPSTRALFPLEVTFETPFMTLQNQAGLSVEVTNIVIPFQSFRMAVALAADGDRGLGPVRMTGSTVCAQIPTYGPFLQKLGLCNPSSDVLSVVGAAELGPFGDATPPSAAEVGTVSFSASADAITATLSGTSLRLGDHVAALLLVDEATGLPLAYDYGLVTRRTADATGLLATVTLPFGDKAPPAKVKAYLMIDVSAVAVGSVTIP
jgi:outer membrane protein assembly factor BamB